MNEVGNLAEEYFYGDVTSEILAQRLKEVDERQVRREIDELAKEDVSDPGISVSEPRSLSKTLIGVVAILVCAAVIGAIGGAIYGGVSDGNSVGKQAGYGALLVIIAAAVFLCVPALLAWFFNDRVKMKTWPEDKRNAEAERRRSMDADISRRRDVLLKKLDPALEGKRKQEQEARERAEREAKVKEEQEARAKAEREQEAQDEKDIEAYMEKMRRGEM